MVTFLKFFSLAAFLPGTNHLEYKTNLLLLCRMFEAQTVKIPEERRSVNIPYADRIYWL